MIIADVAASPLTQLISRDDETLRSRAISPDVAAQRGYRTVTAFEAHAFGFRTGGLLIPSWGTGGEIARDQLRPHDAPMDAKTGKPRKYLWPTGSRQSLDIPPSSLPLLGDVDAPMIVTESILKGDALVSALESEGLSSRFAVASVAGVYGWKSDGMPLSDFGDIRFRHAERGRIKQRRRVLIAFDSDAATNPNVTKARYELAQFLQRRGATVDFIDVPPAADGAKQGVDDALAAGVAISEMIHSAYRAPDVMPALPGLRPGADRRDAGVFVLALKTPHVKAKLKVLVAQLAALAISKRSRGESEPDGRVRLTAAEIAEDWRARTPKGVQLPATNPDGSTPLMRRQTAATLIREAVEMGILDNIEEASTVRQHATRATYRDTDFLMTPPESVCLALAPLAAYAPDEPKQRTYRKQPPCPDCGEIHERRRDTICTGCGAVTRSEALAVRDGPEPSSDTTNEAPDTRVTVNESGSPKNGEVNNLPAPPPQDYLSPKNGEAVKTERTHTPVPGSHAPDEPEQKPDAMPMLEPSGRCLGCGAVADGDWCRRCLAERWSA